MNLLLRSRPGSEQDVHHLLEVEKPERQPQIARIENICLLAERPAVFVVSVKDQNAQVGTGAYDL